MLIDTIMQTNKPRKALSSAEHWHIYMLYQYAVSDRQYQCVVSNPYQINYINTSYQTRIKYAVLMRHGLFTKHNLPISTKRQQDGANEAAQSEPLFLSPPLMFL